MTDYSELKRLATKVDSGDYEFDDVLALGKAASPSVMLAILAELEALRAEYREVSIRAGEWPCKCGWIHPKGVVPTHSCFDKPCTNPPPCPQYRPEEL